MEWVQFIIFFLGVFGLFIWNRTESRNDIRHMDTENKALRRDMIDVMRSIEMEIKDFHGRLCAIEERNKKS